MSTFATKISSVIWTKQQNKNKKKNNCSRINKVKCSINHDLNLRSCRPALSESHVNRRVNGTARTADALLQHAALKSRNQFHDSRLLFGVSHRATSPLSRPYQREKVKQLNKNVSLAQIPCKKLLDDSVTCHQTFFSVCPFQKYVPVVDCAINYLACQVKASAASNYHTHSLLIIIV